MKLKQNPCQSKKHKARHNITVNNKQCKKATPTTLKTINRKQNIVNYSPRECDMPYGTINTKNNNINININKTKNIKNHTSNKCKESLTSLATPHRTVLRTGALQILKI